MANTILSELPLTDKTISVSALLTDLATARRQLAVKRQRLEIQDDEAAAGMDDVDTLVSVILQTQALLKQLVELGLVALDFEAAAND
jgi:hypothetical protein